MGSGLKCALECRRSQGAPSRRRRPETCYFRKSPELDFVVQDHALLRGQLKGSPNQSGAFPLSVFFRELHRSSFRLCKCRFTLAVLEASVLKAFERGRELA